jgi:hypothetical protein
LYEQIQQGHHSRVAETISKPQEDARLQVLREFLLGTIIGMEEWKTQCRAVFAIWFLTRTMDQVGVSE